MVRGIISMCVFLMATFSTLACKAEMNNIVADKEEKSHFYANFSDYKIPLKLVEPLVKKDALARETYYVGLYDSKDKLYRVEKYFKGKLFFKHDYLYHENGRIKESRTVNRDGVEKINWFDEKGNPIK